MCSTVLSTTFFPGKRKIRCRCVYRHNFNHVGGYLDPVTYQPATRSLLRVIGVVHNKIRIWDCYPLVCRWRFNDNQCPDHFHPIVDSEFGRSTSTNCSFEDGLLSCFGNCFIGKLLETLTQAHLANCSDFCNSILRHFSEGWCGFESSNDGHCSFKPIWSHEWIIASVPEIKYGNNLIRTKEFAGKDMG